jgi:hypothetical protein
MSYIYRVRYAVFAFLLLTACFTVFSDVFAQLPGEKKLQTQLKDTLTRENDGAIRVKSGFTLEVQGENGFTVRSLQKEIVGSVSCASCPGGQCRAKLLPPNRGFCVGCSGGACLISPF